MKKFKIFFIRHGKTEANEKRLYCGKSDLSLSTLGKEELKELARINDYPKCSRYYTSGAKRANETFKIIYKNNNYEVKNGFLEYDFGDFELKSYDMLKINPLYIKWIEDKSGQIVCPKGESKKEYRERTDGSFREFLKELEKNNIESSLIICHGGTIGTLLEMYSDMEGDFYSLQPKCGLGYETEVIIEDDKLKIVVLNTIPKERG